VEEENMNNRHQKRSAGEVVFDTVNLILLLLFTALCFYPIWFFLVNSFSSSKAIAQGVYLLPKSLTLYNYQSLFKEVDNLLPAFGISAARTILGTLLTCALSSYTAFLVSQKDLPARKFCYRFVIITMYINAGVIPWFMTMKTYHLNNNFLLYIIPSAITAFFVILLKTYFESIPDELQESAEMDGAGVMTVFLKVIIPLSKPVLASVAVFSAVNQWNSWYDNFMLVSKEKLQTVQYLLYLYLTKNTAVTGNTAVNAMATVKTSPTSIRITITMVTMLPIVIVYPVMQKYFVKGIMLGAVKG
jgi:ABC-type glycerol-3-phosphate transport system permease component